MYVPVSLNNLETLLSMDVHAVVNHVGEEETVCDVAGVVGHVAEHV